MKTKGRKRRLSSRKKTLYIVTVAVLAVALLVFFSQHPTLTLPQHSENKAAIIDQLDDTSANTTFRFSMQALLSAHGFAAYYYQAGAVDVNFYRELPSKGFSLIIFRIHSALNNIEGTSELSLFTGEKWDNGKASTTYLSDVLTDRVVPVAYHADSERYFGITSRFIKESMNGRLDGSTILMMGCDGLSTTEMAEAFVKDKGAKVYIGWKGPVSAPHTDAAAAYLLTALLQGKSVETAVHETMSNVGADPDYGSTFSWYPTQAGNNKL